MNSPLSNLIYGKPTPPAQFLVDVMDYLEQGMEQWCQESISSARNWEARKMLDGTFLVPIWFRHACDALSFKLAFTEYVRDV